jgi:hypothetical protein
MLMYNPSTANSTEVYYYQKRETPEQVHTSEDFTKITQSPLTFAVLQSTLKYINVHQRSFTGRVNNSAGDQERDFCNMDLGAVSIACY